MPHPAFHTLGYIQEGFDDPENILLSVYMEQLRKAHGCKTGGTMLIRKEARIISMVNFLLSSK